MAYIPQFPPETRVAVLSDPQEGMQARMKELGWITPNEARQIQQARNSRFFLVKNGANSSSGGPAGDTRAGCKRCKAKHPYLTHMCVERPFRGLRDALVAYVRNTPGDPRVLTFLTKMGVPNLAAHHPRLAARMLPEVGEELLAFSVGTAEPIDETTALRFIGRIRAKDRHFTV